MDREENTKNETERCFPIVFLKLIAIQITKIIFFRNLPYSTMYYCNAFKEGTEPVTTQPHTLPKLYYLKLHHKTPRLDSEQPATIHTPQHYVSVSAGVMKQARSFPTCPYVAAAKI